MKNVIDRFDYKGYSCIVQKVELPTLKLSYYSGYVQILDLTKLPKNSIECHGGIKYQGEVEDLGYCIGFDCGHGADLFNPKDEVFVKNELMKIVDQLVTAGENHGTMD